MRKEISVFLIIVLLIGLIGCNPAKPETPGTPEAPGTPVTPEIPGISEDALTGSAELINANPEIENPEIIVEDDALKFYMVPVEGQEASGERLKQLGIDFMKILAGYVANEELAGPSGESYGQLYDYYDAEIIVEGERGAVLYRGRKAKGETDIKWEQ